MPEMKNIIEQFSSFFGIRTNKRDEHYQLTGGTQQRIATNVKKLKDIFVLQEITFEESEQVYNIITKAVLDQKLDDQFLSCEKEGETLLSKFNEERLNGNGSIWDPLSKRKLPTFSDNSKKATVKLKEKVTTLKEERRLLNRLTIASGQRPEIDLQYYNWQLRIFSCATFNVFS